MRILVAGILRIVGSIALFLSVAWLYWGVTGSVPKPVKPTQNSVLITTRSANLKVRSGPGRKYGVISRVRKGSIVWKCSYQKGWVRIQAPSAVGWVYGGFTRASKVRPSYLLQPSCYPPRFRPGPSDSFAERVRAGILSSGAWPEDRLVIQRRSASAFYLFGPFMFVLGLLGWHYARRIDKVSQSRKLSRVFHLSSRLSLFLMASMLALSWMFAPPQYQVIRQNFRYMTAKNGRKEIVDLCLVQKSIKVTDLFPLIPTTRELYLRSKDGKRLWSITGAYKKQIESQLSKFQILSTWRYAQGLVMLPLVVLFAFLSWYLWQMRRDALDFERALAKNSFGGYRDFINCKGYKAKTKRTQYYLVFARKRLSKLLAGYVVFLENITARSQGAELRPWFLSLARRLSGETVTKVQVKFESHFDTRMVARPAENRKIYRINEVLNQKMSKTLHDGIIRTLNSVFKSVFSGELISFTTEPCSHVLKIRYDVSDSGTAFYLKGTKVAPEKRDLYAGVKFKWTIQPSSRSKTFPSTSFESLPASHFSVGGKQKGAVFIGMAISAFSSLGKELLNKTGLVGDAQQWRDRVQAGIKPQVHKEVIQSLIDELAEGALDDAIKDHQQEIRDFLSSLHSEFDSLSNQLLGQLSVAGAGFDIEIEI